MKILHFLDSVGHGGAEMQVLDVCRNAREFGLEMTFVTARGGTLEEDFQTSGADFVRLDRRFPVDPALVRRLRRLIREREIRIVHGYQAVENLHLLLAVRGLKNVRQVMSFQGFIPDRKNLLTTRFLISRMDANIVVSKGLKNWLGKEAGLDTSKNFQIIYNGPDPQRLRPSGRSLRKELGLAENTRLIGMIGNFNRDPRKDQLTLCRALPEVFEELADVHCVLAGRVDSGAEEKLRACTEICRERGILERVHFLGARDDVPDILDALDLFVFSSLHEGLPLAVAEAMLVGIPLIVSDIEPLLEISGGGTCAEVFPVKNAEVLSEKILKLLRDEGLRNDLAARAGAFAAENFSIAAHLRELKKLYERLLGG